jgi:two-component system, NarL family, response regulator NreC
MIRIVLADDHSVMRSGLRALLHQNPDMQVVGEANDGREALSLAETLKPDVAVLDITMPNLNGIEAARQSVSKQLDVAIIMLSMHSDEGYVLRALRAGVRGYLLKEAAEIDLLHAIRAVTQGKSFFSPAVSRMLAEDYIRQLQEKEVVDSYDLLTAREREILQLIAEGNSNKDIANRLSLSLHTVETHRGNILQKLNLHSVPDLILYAVRKGVIA